MQLGSLLLTAGCAVIAIEAHILLDPHRTLNRLSAHIQTQKYAVNKGTKIIIIPTHQNFQVIVVRWISC